MRIERNSKMDGEKMVKHVEENEDPEQNLSVGIYLYEKYKSNALHEKKEERRWSEKKL